MWNLPRDFTSAACHDTPALSPVPICYIWLDTIQAGAGPDPERGRDKWLNGPYVFILSPSAGSHQRPIVDSLTKSKHMHAYYQSARDGKGGMQHTHAIGICGNVLKCQLNSFQSESCLFLIRMNICGCTFVTTQRKHTSKATSIFVNDRPQIILGRLCIALGGSEHGVILGFGIIQWLYDLENKEYLCIQKPSKPTHTIRTRRTTWFVLVIQIAGMMWSYILDSKIWTPQLGINNINNVLKQLNRSHIKYALDPGQKARYVDSYTG